MEKGFKEAKPEIGMPDYRVNGWLARTQVMTMIMLAMIFVFMEKPGLKMEGTLLPRKQIRDLLIFLHSGGTGTPKDWLEIILNRHQKRKNWTFYSGSGSGVNV